MITTKDNINDQQQVTTTTTSITDIGTVVAAPLHNNQQQQSSIRVVEHDNYVVASVTCIHIENDSLLLNQSNYNSNNSNSFIYCCLNCLWYVCCNNNNIILSCFPQIIVDWKSSIGNYKIMTVSILRTSYINEDHSIELIDNLQQNKNEGVVCSSSSHNSSSTVVSSSSSSSSSVHDDTIKYLHPSDNNNNNINKKELLFQIFIGTHYIGPFVVMFIIIMITCHLVIQCKERYITSSICCLFAIISFYYLCLTAYSNPGIVLLLDEEVDDHHDHEVNHDTQKYCQEINMNDKEIRSNKNNNINPTTTIIKCIKNQHSVNVPIGYRWCDYCKCYKPTKAVHCHDCNVCIINYDHHCLWMGHCIGLSNYQNFVRFNISWLLYLIYVVIWVEILAP